MRRGLIITLLVLVSILACDTLDFSERSRPQDNDESINDSEDLTESPDKDNSIFDSVIQTEPPDIDRSITIYIPST